MPRFHAECLAQARRATATLFTFMTAVLLIAVCAPAQSQTFKVIHNFKGLDGATAYAGPTLDRSGNLYGTTYLGGAYGSGTVYKMSFNGTHWNYSRLYSLKGLTDAAGPAFGSVVIAPSGAIYATSEGGGTFGTAFEVWPGVNGCTGPKCPWREALMHNFGTGTDGAQPIAGLVMDSAGNLYGTTSEDGANGYGTVFELSRSAQGWTETTLYDFTGGTDGQNPPAGVTLDSAGNLYGTSSFGGVYGNGAIYKLSHSASGWTESIIYSFQGLDDGQNPVGGVILDAKGNLYGGTFDGGANAGGTVYELSPTGSDWTLTTLYSFTGSYGGPYNKLTLDSKGNLYGITNADGANGLGSVFKLTPDNGTWTYTDLHDFTGGTDGGLPYCTLAVDKGGHIFGTNVIGGPQNQGVVFEITQ